MIDSIILKVILLGDSNVGKTSLMNKYVKNIFTTYTNYTIGVEFTTINVFVDDVFATMQIWDTAGQERFNSLCTTYFRGSHCCVLVYDVTNLQSFENLDYWYDHFLNAGAPINKESFPFVLVANKVDLPGHQVSVLQSEAWCKSKNQCPYYGTSAKNGNNVNFMFEKVAEMALRRKIEVGTQFSV